MSLADRELGAPMGSVLEDRTGRRGATGRPPGGSPPKQEAIARAALGLFVRDGYARTSVDAIAAEAGVSKRTVYNHYGDKENLFLSVVRDTFNAMAATFGGVLDARLGEVTDVEQDLTAFAREAAQLLFRSPDRAAMIRLMITEAPHFPELLREHREHMRPRGLTQMLARRLARLAADGILGLTDPPEAAEHLFALTFGLINSRSLFGIVALSDTEIDQIVTGGVHAFARAYRPA